MKEVLDSYSNFTHRSKITIEERAVKLARYIIESKDTVRGTAKKFRNKQKHSTQRCK